MNREDIIRMAREAGLADSNGVVHAFYQLERFASLVAKNDTSQERVDEIEKQRHEPVACDCDSPSWCKQYKKCNRTMLGFMPYVPQSQRTWVEIDDEEWIKALELCDFDKVAAFEFFEAKLKEKNS